MELKEFVRAVQEFTMYKTKIEELTAMQKDSRAKINDGLDLFGVTESKGHISVEINDEASGISKVVRQRKVSKNFDEDVALEILEEKGLTETCVVYEPVLNEEQIMAALYRGDLTEEDVDRMFPEKVTWALTFQK